MNAKDLIIQEIEQAPEPMLEERRLVVKSVDKNRHISTSISTKSVLFSPLAP